MELPNILLFVCYFLTTIVFALIWYIYVQHENMFYERETNAEERLKYTEMIKELQVEAARERKDLYDRLQAGTLPQYKEHVGEPNEITDDTDENIVAMDDAKDEIMGVDNG